MIFVYWLACAAFGVGTGEYAVHGERWALSLALFCLFVVVVTLPMLRERGR